MKYICAFSSDARTLYQADIYRVLALPHGHLIHFRYKYKYVDTNLLGINKKLIGKEVLIFYTYGNSLERKNSSLTDISIRKAKIHSVEKSEDTEVLHVYLKLGEFANIDIDTNSQSIQQDRGKFFTSLDCVERNSGNNWHSRVIAVKDHMRDIVFINIRGIFRGEENLAINYPSDKHSSYSVTFGERYNLKISIGNPNSSKVKINISEPGEDITFACLNPIESSIQFDELDIPMLSKSIEGNEKATYLSFEPLLDEVNLKEFVSNIELTLKRSLVKPALFGALTVLGLFGVGLASGRYNFSGQLALETLVGGLLVWISAGVLFHWFNKK